MTSKTIKYVDQEKQDIFSCKHENTLKSMEFSEGDEQLCLLTDYGDVSMMLALGEPKIYVKLRRANSRV